MTLRPFLFVLLALAVVVLFCAVAGIIAYATVPAPADRTDPAAAQAALKRGAVVFFSMLGICITVFTFLVEQLR